MCYKRIVGALILALVMMCLTPTPVRATTINVEDMDWTRAYATYVKADGVDEYAWAGAIKILLDGIFNRVVLCVDLFTDIYLYNTYNVDLVTSDESSVPNVGRAAWMVNYLLPTVTTPQQGAGLQFAIWDVVHDGGDGFSLGRVQAATNPPTDPAVLAAAVNYLSASVGQSSVAWIYYTFQQGTNTPMQTLIGPATFDGGPVANPEPQTFLLFSTGVVLLVMARCFRVRQ